MEYLLQQLRDARKFAISGQLVQAQRCIDDATELLDDAIASLRGPKPSTRAIRGYLTEAIFAIKKVDGRLTVSALDGAFRELEQEPKG